MTNQEIYKKCFQKKEAILDEINTTPRGWELWLMVRDNEIAWTTVTGGTIPIAPIFSRWGYRGEKVDWSDIEGDLWQDLYNSRGDN